MGNHLNHMHLTTEQLDQIRTYFRSAAPVRRAWLFGSYARGEADEASDVDLLLDLDYNQYIGSNLFRWPEELACLLGRKVDVVPEDSLFARFRPYVDADKRLIYEKSAARA